MILGDADRSRPKVLGVGQLLGVELGSCYSTQCDHFILASASFLLCALSLRGIGLHTSLSDVKSARALIDLYALCSKSLALHHLVSLINLFRLFTITTTRHIILPKLVQVQILVLTCSCLLTPLLIHVISSLHLLCVSPYNRIVGKLFEIHYYFISQKLLLIEFNCLKF